MQVTATDLDGTGRITYTIDDTEDFTINNIGVIMTAKAIDGDVDPFRNTTVSACDDEGKCSQANLSVSFSLCDFSSDGNKCCCLSLNGSMIPIFFCSSPDAAGA